MKNTWGILILGALAVSAQARPDLNAFLNHRAGNLEQLIGQVKRDSEVRDRFKRHFGMNDAELVAYLSTLRASRMQKKKAYIVYSVPPDGRIKAHVETYYSDTPVYTDISGTPILIAKCGNPLNLGPKPAVAENDVPIQVAEAIDQERPMEPTMIPADEVLSPTTILVPETPLEPSVETIGGGPVIIPVAGPIFSPWLLGLLGIGLIDFGDNNNVGGTDLVPEPASFAVLGIGVIALLRRRSAKSGSA